LAGALFAEINAARPFTDPRYEDALEHFTLFLKRHLVKMIGMTEPGFPNSGLQGLGEFATPK